MLKKEKYRSFLCRENAVRGSLFLLSALLGVALFTEST